MAQYKVPQDVEADDKLLGPFSFRQFVYLLIAGGAVALAVFLFQVFPLLAIIPAPIILFFLILALPLKKDQPMETYLAAILSFYLKPRKRFWVPGQRESTIQITAPKKVEAPRTKQITRREAGHRLSFLAELIDTGGQSIKNTSVNDAITDEADNIIDMFDTGDAASIGDKINYEQGRIHQAALDQMRTAIQIEEQKKDISHPKAPMSDFDPGRDNSDVVIQPVIPEKQEAAKVATTEARTADSGVQAKAEAAAPEPQKKTQAPERQTREDIAMVNLAHNKDFSVETIQKEAGRLNKQKEVYISLH